MKFIGEAINTSMARVRSAVETKDRAYIERLALAQKEAGAKYIDVNCGTRIDDEAEIMAWLIDAVQGVVNLPLSIDSPSPLVLEKGLALAKKPAIINSVTGEKERFSAVLPLIHRYKAKVIALLLDDEGMPASADDRIRVAKNLIEDLVGEGVAMDDIIIDPVVRPIGTGDTAGLEVLGAMRAIRNLYPEVHFSIGLSNISHGIPVEEMVNHAFMILCMQEGLDYCIGNVLDERLTGYALLTESLLGKDPYCAKMLKAFRKGKLPSPDTYLDL